MLLESLHHVRDTACQQYLTLCSPSSRLGSAGKSRHETWALGYRLRVRDAQSVGRVSFECGNGRVAIVVACGRLLGEWVGNGVEEAYDWCDFAAFRCRGGRFGCFVRTLLALLGFLFLVGLGNCQPSDAAIERAKTILVGKEAFEMRRCHPA